MLLIIFVGVFIVGYGFAMWLLVRKDDDRGMKF